MEAINLNQLQALLSAIAQLAAARGAGAWLVGGTVRDALLGRPSRDIDVAVEGDALAFARALADQLAAHFVPLDDANGVARVVLADGSGLYADIAAMRGSLDDELRRRDFTIDALAAPIPASATPEAPLVRRDDVVDVCNGLDDVAAGTVRMTSSAAFDDDPLRLLRGVRIASELHFQLDPATAAAIRQRAALLRTAAPERRRDELARILSLEQSTVAFRLLDDLGLLDVLLPELTFGRGVTQPGEWHYYDVFEHNMHALEAMDDLLAVSGSPTSGQLGAELWRAFAWCESDIRAHLAEQLSEGRSRSSLVKLAALLHDIAKPQTRTVTAEGKAHFYGHADEGAAMVARIMRRERFSASEIRYVSRLVAEHLRPVQLAQVGEVPTQRALYRFYRALGGGVVGVLLVALADAAASRGPRMTSDGWSRHVAYMNSLLVRSKEQADILHAPRLLTGRDVMREFGLAEGPRVGELLEALTEAQATGEVSDRQAALEFIRARLGAA